MTQMNTDFYPEYQCSSVAKKLTHVKGAALHVALLVQIDETSGQACGAAVVHLLKRTSPYAATCVAPPP